MASEVIRTVGQLDSLDMWAVLIDTDHNVWQKWPGFYTGAGPKWVTPGVGKCFNNADVVLPALYLARGGGKDAI